MSPVLHIYVTCHRQCCAIQLPPNMINRNMTQPVGLPSQRAAPLTRAVALIGPDSTAAWAPKFLCPERRYSLRDVCTLFNREKTSCLPSSTYFALLKSLGNTGQTADQPRRTERAETPSIQRTMRVYYKARNMGGKATKCTRPATTHSEDH